MEYSSSNYVGSMSVAGSARVQIGNNTTNNFYQADDKKCLAALCSTDPRHDKSRIEQTNGGLLKESYQWILHNPEFQRWCDPKENCPLLWIRGDPGKGKTMLLSGTINELQPYTRLGNSGTDTSLSYFFCQATNAGLNNATAVLRGLAYLLVEQQPSLLSHVRDKVSLSPGHWNSRIAISDLLSEMLGDQVLQNVIFIVDALDECITDLEFLLKFISSTTSTQVKWIVSSRNINEIERRLNKAPMNLALSLELNAESVSQAVNSYIQHRIHKLRVDQEFGSNYLKLVEDHLSQNAHGTFLWVALVCRQLESSEEWEVRKVLRDSPQDLKELYGRMMKAISDSFSKDLYMGILDIISTVYRPISLSELMVIQNIPGDVDRVRKIVMKCGCFLTIKDEVVYFVHQSAKEFLLEPQNVPSPSPLTHHLGLFEKSLEGLETLKMNIYDLPYPATSIDEVHLYSPEHDPLSGLAYLCEFWADHLRDSQAIYAKDPSSQDQFYNKVYRFMATKFLFWLEALSLLQSLPAAMKTLQILEDLPLGDETLELVEDAQRFFLFFRSIIETHPLQTYVSGLLFSPGESLIRRRFEDYSPKFVVKKPEVDAQWPPYLSISAKPEGVTFSADNNSLVITSFRTDNRDPSQLTKWNVGDGMRRKRTDYEGLYTITPSPDLNWLAALATGRQWEVPNLQVRDLESDIVQWSIPLQPDQGGFKAMKFSPDSQWLAVLFSNELLYWGFQKNEFTWWPLEVPHEDHLQHIEFSSDGYLVAIFGFLGRHSGSIVVLDVRNGEQHNHPSAAELESIRSAVFSPNTHEIMMCSGGKVWSWDVLGKQCKQWRRLDGFANHIAISHNSSWIAVESDSTVSLYEKQSKELLQQFERPSPEGVSSITVSFDDQRLAVNCVDHVYLWDISSSTSKQTHCHGAAPKNVVVSDNGSLMAWVVEEKIQSLDAMTGNLLPEFDISSCWRDSLSKDNLAAVSSQGHLLVTSTSSRLFVWDLNSKKALGETEVPGPIDCLAVSRDEDDGGQWVAAIAAKKILVWDSTAMEAPRWFVEHSTVKDESSSQLQFSNGKLAVLWSQGGCPHLTYYDVTSGAQTTSLELPSSRDGEEYFYGFSVSPSGRRAAWRSSGICERWDIFISQGEGGIQSVSMDVAMDAWYEPRLSFLDDSTVLTDRGMLDIDAFLAEAPIEPNAPHKFVEDIPNPRPEFTGYGCSDDRDWITLDGENLIWLPVQYRPKSLRTRFAAGERHFATHCSSGILCMNFSEDARDLF